MKRKVSLLSILILQSLLISASLSTYEAAENKLEKNAKVASTGNAKNDKVSNTTGGAAKNAVSTKGKPKIMPWKAFKSGEEEERTYNIFRLNAKPQKIELDNPENWRTFDPACFANKKALVPNPDTLTGVAPTKYPSPDVAMTLDPAKSAAVDGIRNKVVFAHQGTPLANGWIAPQAGYAYQIDGTMVYGTTNYTPINYNGNLNKFIGVGRVPVDILSPSGAKQPLDLSRLVFPVNDNLLSRPQARVYPSVIYLKPGEIASIQGHGNVKCPRIEQPEQISLQTPNGEQSIKVICTPEQAVIPGKVSP